MGAHGAVTGSKAVEADVVYVDGVVVEVGQLLDEAVTGAHGAVTGNKAVEAGVVEVDVDEVVVPKLCSAEASSWKCFTA